MNEFLNKWQPKVMDVNESDLVLTDRFDNETRIYASEGDTLYIHQDSANVKNALVTLERHELYNIIFNFMNSDELFVLASKRKSKEENEKYNTELKDDEYF